MSLRDFLHGSGTLVVEDKFLSLRLIKEALERKFRIVILEETSKHLKCKIVRFARVFGFPVPFPNPTLEVTFRNEDYGSTIQYDFTCYDYCLLAIAAPLLAALPQIMGWKQGFIDNVKEALLLFLMAIFFFGFLIFLDTKYFVSRIRKALLSM